MSEEDETTTAATSSGETAAASATFTQADLDRVVADRLSREREKLGKKYADYDSLKGAADELAKLRSSQMSEQEKAVAKATAEAEERGRTTALTQSGKRLARAEFKAAAKGRMEPDAIAGALELLDLTKFVGADGEPDDKAIEAAVTKLAGPTRPANFDGGARSTAKTTDMNALIRNRAGLG